MTQTECNKWVARDKKVIAPCQHLSYFPLVVERGDGDIITDADGNEFIDFLTSASSLNLGSRNPILMKAIADQMARCTQYTAAYTYNAPMIELAERLISVYPGGVEAKVCFGNCGSDANDAAVKFSRAYTGRQKIITFENSYHGNTYGSSTLSACSARMSEKMGPFLPEVYHFPFYGENNEREASGFYVKEMKAAFETYLPPRDVAAIIIEPMQGDGGLIMAHPQFISELYDLCKEYGILFISEEVQQGLFRNGHWFSIENYGIVPDGIILGKSLGAGLTLGAFMARGEIMDCLPAPAHLFTLSGNHLACAASVAEFDYMKSDEFQGILRLNMELMALLVKQTLEKKGRRCLRFARGNGMSYGLYIGRWNEGPDLDGAFKILYRCYEYGLLIISVAGNVLRIQPPLNISAEHLKKGFEIINQAMDDYENGLIPDEVLQHRHGW